MSPKSPEGVVSFNQIVSLVSLYRLELEAFATVCPGPIDGFRTLLHLHALSHLTP